MKKINLIIIMAVAVLSIFSSCKKEVIITDLVITGNVVWDQPEYVINGTVSFVNGGVLTISPGTTLKFETGGKIEVGYSENSTFIAEGTEKDPIIFTSNHPAPTAGAWTGIIFYSNTQENSSMKYCEIEYAGNANYYQAAIVIDNCKITMENCKISKSAGYGIYAYNCKGFTNPFINNTIEDCTDHVMSMNLRYLQTLGTGNVYSPEANKGILVGYENYSSTTSQTWTPQTAAYYVDGSYGIEGSLTIADNCVFKFGSDDGFYFGYSNNTSINANAVTFTSSAETPTHGDWYGLIFYSNTQTANLTNCIISSAGQGGDYDGAVEISYCTVNLDGSTISKSESWGIYLDYESSYTGTVTFSDNTLGDVYESVK